MAAEHPDPMNTTASVPTSDQALSALYKQIAEGFLYTHAQLNESTKSTLEASAFLYALIELLNERGLLPIDELDARKNEVIKRLVKKHSAKGAGVLLQEPEYDKYAFDQEAEIDCASRIRLCKAACCRLPFALSKQDIREAVVRWDLGQPYVIAQDDDGYCTHMDRNQYRCRVREHRPVPCRAYDCRKDHKIWLNFADRVINPDILRQDWPRNADAAESGSDFA